MLETRTRGRSTPLNTASAVTMGAFVWGTGGPHDC